MDGMAASMRGASMAEVLDPEVVAGVLVERNLGDWEVADGKLHAEFVFDDFAHAWRFMGRVALLAESRNHHPGITDRDVELAAVISELPRD
jgi:pterin-4a-carbinolamine dehydratase